MLGTSEERRNRRQADWGSHSQRVRAVQGSAEWPLAYLHDVPLKTKQPKICLNQGEGRSQCTWWEQGGAVPIGLSTDTWGSCSVVP